MAAANPTFHPIPALDPRSAVRPIKARRIRPWSVAMFVFGALGAAAALGLRRTPSSTTPLTAPVFMSFAVGDIETRVPVRSEPSGGDTVASLAAGTRVSIGGRVSFGGAWSRGVAYWVATTVDGGTVQGFVPAGAVILQAGEPPELDVAGGGAAVLAAGVNESAAPDALSAARSAGDAAAPDVAPSVASNTDDAHASAAASVAVGLANPSGDLDMSPSEGAVHAASAASAADVVVPLTGASASTAPPSQARTVVDIPWLPETILHWTDLLEAAAGAHGVAADLLAIIALVESGGHPAARSHVGATGLMQVMPATATDIARQRGLGAFDATRLTDPAVAIDFGAWYLAQQLKSFGRSDDDDWANSVVLAAAAYNGGPGAAMRYVRGGGLPSETQAYVGWVGGMWRERADAASPTYDRWMAAGGSVLVDKAAVWLAANGG
ncbi:MAG: transglycosylase SLT domain-containing protein [Ardenticatenales bacterium]